MANTYNLDLVQCIVGTLAISGYGEGGGVEVESNSPIQEQSVGADGASIYNRMNDKSLTVTITLREDSRAYRILAGLMQAQEAAGTNTPLAFMLLDPLNGDSVASQYTIFMERPNLSKAQAAGDRVFVISLPDPVVVYGALNV